MQRAAIENVDLKTLSDDDVPLMVTASPGPKSLEIWAKEAQYISPGLSGSTNTSRLVLDAGLGAYLKDVDGNVYIDFSSGVVMTNAGHCHPKVVAALNKQTARLMNVHDHAVPDRWRLCKKLGELTPGRLKRVQLYSGGTETVEAAFRLAKSFTGGTEIISFWNDFHGKTLGALGVDGTGFRKGFGPLAPGYHLVPHPNAYRPTLGGTFSSDQYIAFLEQYIDVCVADKVAAIVAEPIQGSGGTVIPPLDWFKKLKALCEKIGCLLIVDEILTGFGRTGKWFAIEHFGVEPDIMLLGKGMGCGFPVGALISRDEIIEAKPFARSSGGSTSFGGNPMAVAAALAHIEALEEDKLVENAARVGAVLLERLEAMRASHPLIGDVRGLGLLITVELVKDRQTRIPADAEGKDLFLRAMNRGLLTITPKGNLRFAPPLCISEKLALKAVDIFDAALTEIERSRVLSP